MERTNPSNWLRKAAIVEQILWGQPHQSGVVEGTIGANLIELEAAAGNALAHGIGLGVTHGGDAGLAPGHV